MKHFLFYVLLLIVACGDSETKTMSETAVNPNTEKEPAQATPSAENGDIVGEWELVGSVQDTNDNLLIDDEERNNLKAASYKDYMTLNGDGTGLFTVAKMEGRYEAKADETGKRYLNWFDTGNGRHRVGTIVSVSKDELQIKEPGGNGLFLWKRV